MRRTLVIGAATAVAIVLTLGTIEILAIAGLSLSDGRYISARERFDREVNRYIRDVTRVGRECQYIDSLFPHPYLAFVHHSNPPCGVPGVNNIGLFGTDFPSDRLADRFVILLTGGSVAAQFAQITPGGPKYLEMILNRSHLSPTGKPFIVLNGGDGGWKQPQQAILFLLWSDVVDAVITLDGFNELGALRGTLRFDYPANNFFTVNPLARRDYGAAMRRWMLGRLVGWASQNTVTGRSHAAFLAVSSLRPFIESDPRRRGGRRTSLESMFELPSEWDSEKRVQSAIEQYRKYIRAMNAIARDRGIRSAYFIQPAPAIGKQLTEEERVVVGDLSYGPVYRRMTDGLLGLRSEKIPVFSLLEIFADVEGTLYDDPIHLKRDTRGESVGYRLMAEKMAYTLAEAWQLRARH
jgi:hypothetical protein